MERDKVLDPISPEDWISTHTLTWSVTGAKLDDNAIIGISTHTLTWSVTVGAQCPLEIKEISTHTLTWSVTWHYGILH